MNGMLEKNSGVWQLQQAKARFSEVVNRALDGVPQLVTRSGRPSVYVVSAETYSSDRQQRGLDRKKVLLSGPSSDIELDSLRCKLDGREVCL